MDIPVDDNDDDDDTSGWAKKLMTKMDGVAVRLDDAVKIATEAKEGLKDVETRIGACQNDIGTMRKEWNDNKKELEVWKTAMEEKTDFVDSVAEVSNDLEKMLAGMSRPDPWAAWKDGSSRLPGKADA